MRKEIFDSVLRGFEEKMGPCPEKFKTFLWKQAENNPMGAKEFEKGLTVMLMSLNNKFN